MSTKELVQNIIGGAIPKEAIRDRVKDKMEEEGEESVSIPSNLPEGVQETISDVIDEDIDEGRLREVLGLDQDEDLSDQVDSGEEIGQMAIDAVQGGEVSEDEMIRMLTFASNTVEGEGAEMFDTAKQVFQDEFPPES